VRSFADDLLAAELFHGHICNGTYIGLRLARMACRLLEIDDPHARQDVVVYVEMDRCPVDAISVVTGVTLGTRRLKWVDYGKMAATFVDLASGRALRVAPRPDGPHPAPGQDVAEFWAAQDDEAVFAWGWLDFVVPEADRPGRPVSRVVCGACGEQVVDGREVEHDGRTLCRPCAGEPYYATLGLGAGSPAST
jgi:formylmethanofuran dehydrogenase subunit E